MHPESEKGQVCYTLESVKDERTFMEEWVPVFEKIFMDPADRVPPKILLVRMLNNEHEKFFLLRDEKGKPAGIELVKILLSNKNTYVLWTGVLEEYRNLGIGSQMNRRISDHMRDLFGVRYTLLDIEDPERLYNSSYSREELPEAMENAVRRINFWRRQGFFVVDDASRKSGEKLEYVRPGLEDDQHIQGYDHMTVRFADKSLESRVLNADKTQILKSFVRESYLDMNRIQYGNLLEAELRQNYPAIDKYLTDIDKEPGIWLALRSEPIRPKMTPVANVDIHILPEGNLSLAAPELPKYRSSESEII